MPCANRTTNTDTSYVRCPVLTNHFGKSTARVLQQLHYWLSYENLSYGIIHDNRQWIRNSYNQWHQQIKKTNQDLAIITIRRAFSDLEKQSVVLSHCFEDHKNYMGGNQVKSYTIDYDRLESIVGDLTKTLISRPRSIQEQQSSSTEQTYNRARDTSSFSIVSVHTNVQNVCQKRAPNPDQMSTPRDQMSTPLNRYISNKHSNKLSHFRAPRGIEQTQHRFGDAEIIQPAKPAERNEIDFSKEMIKFWNEIVEENNPERKILLNSKRSQNLNSALKQFFENDLAKWERFCHKITTCKFLMGEVTRFKAPIDWTISSETIQKIQEGGYTFGTREPTYRLKLSEIIGGVGEGTVKASSTRFVPSMQESAKASAIRDSIKKEVDSAQYASWFLPTEIVIEKNENGNDVATLCVPTRFMGERIKTHYRDIYEFYFKGIFVGSAEQYVQSRNSHNSVANSQTLDRINDGNALEISDPIKKRGGVNVYDEQESSALSSSEENRKRESTADFMNERNSYRQQEMLSNSSSCGVDLAKRETTDDISEHNKSALSKKDSCETSDIATALIKTFACGDTLCLVNDDVTEQQEMSPTRIHTTCATEPLSRDHTLKYEKPTPDLIREQGDERSEKSADSSYKESEERDVKPYSSALNDLKRIQIRKKIKKLDPESLSTQWFKNETIVIEEGRGLLPVPTYSIKHPLEAPFHDMQENFLDAVKIIDEQALCTLSSFPLEEKTLKENIIEPLNEGSSSRSDVNERRDFLQQQNAGVEKQGYGSVLQHTSEEPPDTIYVGKKIKERTFNHLSVLLDKFHCFEEKTRCRDPVIGILNDEISMYKVRKVGKRTYFYTSISKVWHVNDNDPPDIKREAICKNKESSLVRFSKDRHHRRELSCVSFYMKKQSSSYKFK